MPNNSIKIDAFEYLVSQFIAWHNSEFGSIGIPNDFTILKLIKLNFFAAAVNTDHKNAGLLDVFDNFYAMPLGHVESDVYQNRRNLNVYNFNQTKVGINNDINLSQELKNRLGKLVPRLDSAISQLKEKNKKFIGYAPMDLVEISHQWNSWKQTYRIASRTGKRSEKIPRYLIQNDVKTYYF